MVHGNKIKLPESSFFGIYVSSVFVKVRFTLTDKK